MGRKKHQEVARLEYLEQKQPTPIRVLVLVLSLFEEPWKSWQRDGQDKTFLNDTPDGVRVLRFCGLAREKRLKFRLAILIKRTQHYLQKFGWSGSIPVLSSLQRYLSRIRVGDSTIARIKSSPGPCNFIQGPSSISTVDVIFTPIPSNPELIGLSTIEAFGYALENYDFQYIFRTNSSSYVNLNKLMKLTESLPKTGLYAGVEGRIFRTTTFASGAGYLISKDVVEEICQSSGLWRHGLIDDVALADFVSTSLKVQIEQTPLPRSTIAKLKDAKALSRQELQDHFHYRCKTDSIVETVKIMHQIHSLEKFHNEEN